MGLRWHGHSLASESCLNTRSPMQPLSSADHFKLSKRMQTTNPTWRASSMSTGLVKFGGSTFVEPSEQRDICRLLERPITVRRRRRSPTDPSASTISVRSSDLSTARRICASSLGRRHTDKRWRRLRKRHSPRGSFMRDYDAAQSDRKRGGLFWYICGCRLWTYGKHELRQMEAQTRHAT